MSRPPRQPDQPPARRMRGFEAASGLLAQRIQKAGEARGFATSRLLTCWPEIAGADMAAVTRPVRVGYGHKGLGAVLTLLVAPGHGPMVQMQLPALRARVNAAYGYNAISRIALAQTAPEGFAEGQATFAPAPAARPPEPDPEIARAATDTAGDVRDEGLRAALETLARNVLSRART